MAFRQQKAKRFPKVLINLLDLDWPLEEVYIRYNKGARCMVYETIGPHDVALVSCCQVMWHAIPFLPPVLEDVVLEYLTP